MAKEEGEEEEGAAAAEVEVEEAAGGSPNDTGSERGRYGLRKRGASAHDVLPEAAETLCPGAALPIPASANGTDWPGGRLALAGGDGGAESQGLLGETRTLLEEARHAGGQGRAAPGRRHSSAAWPPSCWTPPRAE